MKKMMFAMVLSVLALVAGGCIVVAAGAGAGTVAYVRGDLEPTFEASVDKVYDATLKSMEQLELMPTQKNKDSLGSEIIARTSADKKVTIKTTRVAENLTKVSIRIGIFGDESLSRAIHDKIKTNL